MSLVIETIAIGDELLTGKISDTNSTFVAGELFSLGAVVSRQTVIPDQVEVIKRQLDESSRRAQMVICFGGLGPTTDDLTVDCVAELLGGGVTVHPGQKEKLIALYQKQNRPVDETALRQVRYPKKSEPIGNTVGLAPGFRCELGNCIFFFVPGVPGEMRGMVRTAVKETATQLLGKSGEPLHSHFWRCVGIWESQLQTLMNPLERELPQGAWLGYRTTYPENQLSLYYRQGKGESLEPFLTMQQKIREAVAPYAYTECYDSLEATVVQLLIDKKRSIALAESCTGGLVTHRLTRIPGCSDVVWGGAAVYQLGAKEILLGVRCETEDAAVSAVCSRQLAEAVKNRSGCPLAAAITGYMGPEPDGTETNPSGTIFTAVVGEGNALREERFVLTRPDRQARQWGASTLLLDQIRREIETLA